MIDVSRRQAVTCIAGLGAQIGLSACSLPITPFCPTDPTISDPSAPLTIDIHTHVFNGSDLQVRGFFNWVVLNNGASELGAILQELGRDFAPTAAEAGQNRLGCRRSMVSPSWLEAYLPDEKFPRRLTSAADDQAQYLHR